MQRISHINSHFTSKRGSHVDDSIKFLNFDDSFFTPEVNEYRLNLRRDLEAQVAPYVSDTIEKAEPVYKFVEVLRKHGCGTCYYKKPYGEGQDRRKVIATILELGRIDASLATFYLVQVILMGNTIGNSSTRIRVLYFWISGTFV